MAAFRIDLTTGSGTPIYRQIIEQVRLGVLESHHGKGFFVAEKRQVYSRAERLRRLRQAVEAFVHEAVFLDFTPDEIRQVVNEKLNDLDLEAKPVGDRS